jgi:hypothetical protein
MVKKDIEKKSHNYVWNEANYNGAQNMRLLANRGDMYTEARRKISLLN